MEIERLAMDKEVEKKNKIIALKAKDSDSGGDIPLMV